MPNDEPNYIPPLALWRAFIELSPMAFAFFLAAVDDDGQAGDLVTDPAAYMAGLRAAGWVPD